MYGTGMPHGSGGPYQSFGFFLFLVFMVVNPGLLHGLLVQLSAHLDPLSIILGIIFINLENHENTHKQPSLTTIIS